MSVLRAILGRFARFLVRIARKLDPGLSSASYALIPEQMAALRLRYPGAPEHWLQLVARHVTMNDGMEPRSHPAEFASQSIGDEVVFPAGRSVERRELVQIKGSSATSRTAEHFRNAPARPRVVAAARPSVGATSNRSGNELAPSSKRVWPRLIFHAPRMRRPVTSLLRLDRRKSCRPMVRFPSEDLPSQVECPREPDHKQPEVGQREHRTIFPPLHAPIAERPKWIDQPESARNSNRCDVDDRWPSIGRSALMPLSWLDQGRAGERANPHFAAPDNRWPDLPRQADEPSAPNSSARDEAALFAEQIGGVWSE